MSTPSPLPASASTDLRDDASLPPDAVPGEPPDPPVKVPLAIEDVLSVVIMAVLCLITFANVVVRYLTDQSFAWTEEISVFLMIVLTLVAGGAAVTRDRHIRIEYFAERGPAERQRRLAMAGAFCSLVFFLLLAWLSARLVWDEYRFEETSPGIGVPKWWYSIWLPLLSIGIAARALGVLVRKSRRTP